MSLRESVAQLSPSINKFDDVFIHLGLTTDFGKPFGSEPQGRMCRTTQGRTVQSSRGSNHTGHTCENTI